MQMKNKQMMRREQQTEKHMEGTGVRNRQFNTNGKGKRAVKCCHIYIP